MIYAILGGIGGGIAGHLIMRWAFPSYFKPTQRKSK